MLCVCVSICVCGRCFLLLPTPQKLIIVCCWAVNKIWSTLVWLRLLSCDIRRTRADNETVAMRGHPIIMHRGVMCSGELPLYSNVFGQVSHNALERGEIVFLDRKHFKTCSLEIRNDCIDDVKILFEDDILY